MLRDLLNKYHVDSLPELKKVFFGKLKKENTPDDYIKEVQEKKAQTPRFCDFHDLLNSYRVADMLPYEWYDPETFIYQTSRSYGFIFECGVVSGYQNGLDEQIRQLFSIGIPDFTGMQVLLIASSDLEQQFAQYQSLHKTPLLSRIAKERINFYRKGLKKSLQPGYKFPVRDFRLVISFAFDGYYDESNKSAIISLHKSITTTLNGSKLYNQPMEPTGLINLLREILCIQMQPVEPHTYNNKLSIRKQVSDPDNDIFIDEDGMCINDMGVKSMIVSEYPEEFRLHQCNNFVGDMLSKSSQISYPFMIVQNILFLNQKSENNKLSTDALKTAEQVKKGKFTALFPLFHKKHAEYKLLKNAIDNGEGVVLMNHMVHVFYPLGESAVAQQEVKSLFKTFNWEVVTAKNLQLPALLYSLPLNHDFQSSIDQKKLQMITLYTETNATNTMPIFAEYKGPGNPLLMFLAPCGQVAFYDFFQSETNYNVAISAESGAGKSFVTNEIIKSYRTIDTRVSVIDVGRSYQDTCAASDGQYIEFTHEAGICINPFSFIKFKFGLEDDEKAATLSADDIEKLEELDLRTITKEKLLGMKGLDDQIEMLKSIFLASAGMEESDGRFTLASSYFEQAIINSLQKFQQRSTYTTVYDELMELKDDAGMSKMLAESIKSYTKHGIYGRYFEGESNLDINNPFIVLELEELQGKGQLKFIVLLILMLKITQDMYLSERSIRKICIIDEAWDLMDGGNTGKFIETGYRRARKYNGAFITITQSIDDYAANATTKACYKNAAIKIMLRQKLPETVEIDDYLKLLLQNIQSEAGVYSEMVIQMNKSTSMVRFLPDDFTMMLYSTKAEDIILLQKVKLEENLETEDGVIRLFEIRKAYSNKFNRYGKQVTNDLLGYLNNYSYQSLIQQLGISEYEKVPA